MLLEKFLIRIIHYAVNLITSKDFDIVYQIRVDATQETLQYVKDNNITPKLMILENKKFFDKVTKHLNDNGLILEFGVANGDSVNQIAKLLPKKIVYGFDSFEGLPSEWFTCDKASFSLKGKQPKVEHNVNLIKGLFEDTLSGFLKNHKDNISLLHVDCDLYEPTKYVLDLLSDRIVSGTYIIFDEYWNYPNWKNHEFKAFNEFLLKTNKKFEYVTFNGQTTVCVKII